MAVVGVGADLESAESFRRKKMPKDRRFFERIFSPGEISYCSKFRDPAPHFAARFCAKEALIKAAGAIVPLFVSDAEVRSSSRGVPSLRPRSGRMAVKRFFSTYEALVSLSHTDELAIALVVIQKKGRG